MRDLNSYGIVGVIEPGVDERQMALYRAVHDAGEMTVRTDVLYRAMRKADVEKGIAAIKAEKNDDMLRFVGIKFPLDGGVEGGRMTWPYRIVPGEQTDPAYRGVLLLPPGGEDEYVEGLKLIAEAGLQAQTHAVGDETIDVIVRAYERVNRERPIRDLRWAIMHLFHPSDAALQEDGGDRHHGDDAGSSRAARPQPAPLVGRRARRLRDPDPQGDRRRRAGRRRHRRTGGAGRSVPVDVVDDDAAGAQGLRARQEHAITAKEALTLYTINNARIMGVEKDRGSDRAGQARGPRRAVAGYSVGRATRSATPRR